MTTRLFLLPLLLASVTPVHLSADDQVRSVQEELRRRKLYFGDVDGRETSEVDEAVKRYQKRKGLSTAGVRDAETLRSLGLAGRGDAPPKEVNWPEGQVLKSDLTINVAQAAEEIAQETGVASASIVGEKLTGFDPSSRTVRGRARSVAAARRSATRGGGGTAEASGGTALSGPSAITPSTLRKFVDEFLEAAEGETVRDELRFYADRVTYYHNGLIDRRVIERSLLRYHERWPHRRYRQSKAVQYSFDPRRAQITVLYEVEFTLKSRGKKVKGSTLNRMIINAATSDPRIIAIQEQRAR